jgi:hypothetical protein
MGTTEQVAWITATSPRTPDARRGHLFADDTVLDVPLPEGWLAP